MSNISREEERKIREWQKRTGGGCIDRLPTTEERIAENEAQIRRGLEELRRLGELKEQP